MSCLVVSVVFLWAFGAGNVGVFWWFAWDKITIRRWWGGWCWWWESKASRSVFAWQAVNLVNGPPVTRDGEPAAPTACCCTASLTLLQYFVLCCTASLLCCVIHQYLRCCAPASIAASFSWWLCNIRADEASPKQSQGSNISLIFFEMPSPLPPS